jgi:uncharacterized protein (DUF1697 family)
MHRYITFLRAINVGGHTVKMDQLRSLFEALSFSNVATFIASGNVIFDTKSADTRALESKIERNLKKSLGYEVATFIRSVPEVVAIAQHQPFPSEEIDAGTSLFVLFLRDAPAEEQQRKLNGLRSEVDQVHVNGREIYWRIRGGFSDSKLSGASIEKTARMPGTARNITTVRKLAAKYG